MTLQGCRKCPVHGVCGPTALTDADGPQPGWSALTGQTFEQYHGYRWSNAVHPDDRAGSIASWREAVAEKTTYIWEHRVLVTTRLSDLHDPRCADSGR